MFRGVTYQVWRLSDLNLLKTEYFDVGENRYAQISPEEPRMGRDGSVFVQTLGCGIEPYPMLPPRGSRTEQIGTGGPPVARTENPAEFCTILRKRENQKHP